MDAVLIWCEERVVGGKGVNASMLLIVHETIFWLMLSLLCNVRCGKLVRERRPVTNGAFWMNLLAEARRLTSSIYCVSPVVVKPARFVINGEQA